NVNVISLRSGKHLATNVKNTSTSKVSESDSQPMILDDPDQILESLPNIEGSFAENTRETAIDLHKGRCNPNEEEEINQHENCRINRPSRPRIDRVSTSSEPVIERVYKPLPPFPSLPLTDAMNMAPSIKKYVKD